MGLDEAFGVMEYDSIGTRTIAGVWSRFLLPVMVLWLYGLATGEGYSVKFFTLPLLTDTLAPISYNMYLFHQWVGQMWVNPNPNLNPSPNPNPNPNLTLT
tara:strand:+ start:497 stop:796 length:300 start_codon:yes stop_codon:yes gene_type:complete